MIEVLHAEVHDMGQDAVRSSAQNEHPEEGHQHLSYHDQQGDDSMQGEQNGAAYHGGEHLQAPPDIPHPNSSLVEALHAPVPLQMDEQGNIQQVHPGSMHALQALHVQVSPTVVSAEHQPPGTGFKQEVDGMSVPPSFPAARPGETKVDKRFGKRSETARSAVSAGMKIKANKRKEAGALISLGDRLMVAEMLERKEISPKDAQAKLGCCKSYISQMMKPDNLAKLKRKASLGLDLKLTKAHLPKFPVMEEELNKWIIEMSKNQPGMHPPVTTNAMQEKALEIATQLQVVDFKASNTWFMNFIKRYGLERLGFHIEESPLKRVGTEQHPPHMDPYGQHHALQMQMGGQQVYVHVPHVEGIAYAHHAPVEPVQVQYVQQEEQAQQDEEQGGYAQAEHQQEQDPQLQEQHLQQLHQAEHQAALQQAESAAQYRGFHNGEDHAAHMEQQPHGQHEEPDGIQMNDHDGQEQSVVVVEAQVVEVEGGDDDGQGTIGIDPDA